jgi:hypothetical protein
VPYIQVERVLVERGDHEGEKGATKCKNSRSKKVTLPERTKLCPLPNHVNLT